MSFLHPGWLMLLLILPFILLGAILTHRGRNKAWQCMVAPRLRKQLVVEGSSTRRWVALALTLTGCALAIIVIARPHYGESTVTEQIRTRNILIAIDTSRSMLVQDVSPDRIGNAKTMALELKNAFPKDRIGIIAFSGTPVLMSPLTIDHSSVHETISQLDTKVIPSGGSDLAAAVQLAIKTFKKSGHQSNALIIISDGEDHSQQIQLAGSEIRDAGIAVCTIGIGNTDGGVIPDFRNSDGKYRDASGRTVYSKLNPDSLEQLAQAGRGSYLPASSGADNAIRQALAFLKSDQQSGRDIIIAEEIYHWFLFPAIVLLALSLVIRSNLFRPRVASPATALLAMVLLLSLTDRLEASIEIKEAAAAYESDDYEAALEMFGKALLNAKGQERHAIQFSQGSSAYRLQQWSIASRHFSRSLLTDNRKLQEQSHYNLGNALFQSGWSILNPPESTVTKTETETANPFLEPMRRLLAKGPKKQDASDQAQLSQADIKHITTHWQDAITHYQSAIDINPDNRNALHNRKEVEKLLKQLQDAQQQAKKESEDQKSEQEKQGEGDPSEQQKDDQGQGDDSQKDSDKNGEGDPNNKSDDQNQGEQQENNSTEHPDEGTEEPQSMERGADESKEAFAARILREQSDAETRPVQRRLLRLRRPAKDW